MGSCICHHATPGRYDSAADPITFFAGMHDDAVHKDAAIGVSSPAADRTQRQCTAGMSATTVLNTIQNCYTGNGATDGSNLTYTYGVGGSFGDEVPGSGTLTVTYTLVSP